jgi:hypothetical protein
LRSPDDAWRIMTDEYSPKTSLRPSSSAPRTANTAESIVEPRPLLRSAGSSCSLRGAEDNRVADRMGAGNNFTIARDELVHAEACPLCRHERMKVGLVTPLELVMHRRAVPR